MKAYRKGVFPIVLVFLATTVGLALWARFVRHLFPGRPLTITPAHYQGVAPETNVWLEPWQRWKLWVDIG